MSGQMALFGLPEPEPPPKPVLPPVEPGAPVLVNAGPVGCASHNCKHPGHYLIGESVMCEKHMRERVRSMGKEAAKKHPLVICCQDGFNEIVAHGRADHKSLGKFQRVQICSEKGCHTIFEVDFFWTGEPAPCPDCRRKHWQDYQDWLKDRETGN